MKVLKLFNQHKVNIIKYAKNILNHHDNNKTILNNYYTYGYGNSTQIILNFVTNNYKLFIKHNYNHQQNNDQTNKFFIISIYESFK